MQEPRSTASAPDSRQWLLKRNCALSPRQLGAWFGVLALVSIGIAALFAAQGAWPVVPFAGVEVVALAVAYVVYGRHAADYEKIVLAGDRVLVETASANLLSRREWPRAWLRVEYEGGPRELIRLVHGREALVVGRYVADKERGELATQLRTSLACP